MLWTEGPATFSFLVDTYGFTGPHTVEPSGFHAHGGLRYERGILSIEICVWSGHGGEQGVSTKVWVRERSAYAGLSALYVAHGLGSERDVPDGGGSGHVVRKRIGEQSAALRKVVPHLVDVDPKPPVWTFLPFPV
ncbi:hypothetical protein LFM09_33340 [Lentzea alba]|uniref:hypothetical protein n=1 Tax=Lentzea alba TaxID=2714351 RepID=UPI0039BF5DB2